MGNSLIAQGSKVVQKAISADNEGEYEKALGLYRDALACFTTGLKYEKNEARKKLILERAEGYMNRAEELSDYVRKQSELDKKGGGGAAAENDTPWMKEMRERFIKADGNMDGTLTLKEFFQLQASMGEDPHDITSSQTALVNASMMSRMEALESTVAANALKLDQILAVLSDSTKGRR